MSAKKRRVHRRLDDFPPEAKALVDQMLEDPRTTYREVAEAVNERFGDISYVSIFRYANDAGKAKQRMIFLRQETEQLVAAMKDHQDIEAGEVASALIMDGLVRRIASADEEYEDMSLEKAAKLLVSLQRSAVYRTRTMEDKRRMMDKLEDLLLSQLKDQVQGDEALTEKLTGMVHASVQEVLADESK